MKLKRYTLIRVDVARPYELARAEFQCDCGARVVMDVPDDLTTPACRACEVAYRRFMTRATSTTFKAKEFTLPRG